ncbi:MAG: 50S ribosomal protein L1 [Candidatus Aenigmatarchaeota archaeon]
MALYKIPDAVEYLRQSKKRGFTQSIDMILNLKNIDLRKTENRISKEIVLPHGTGKDVKVGIISDTVQGGIKKADIESIDKKGISRLAKQYDFFICEAPLMMLVGKMLGKMLGPQGKMPSPIPPNVKNISAIIETKKKAVRVRLKDTPTMHLPVGKETMNNEQIEENIKSALSEIEKFLPKGKNQIRSIYLKLTMSKPVRIEI